MPVIINSFLFIFFTAGVVDFAISGLKLTHLAIIFVSAMATSLISYKFKVIKQGDELSFLYLNLYSMLLKKYFTDFVKMAMALHKPFFLKFKIEPTLFKVQIKNHDKINATILASMVNMSQGLLLYNINKDIVQIYCLNEDDYTNLNLLRLTKDIRDINDNSLV